MNSLIASLSFVDLLASIFVCGLSANVVISNVFSKQFNFVSLLSFAIAIHWVATFVGRLAVFMVNKTSFVGQLSPMSGGMTFLILGMVFLSSLIHIYAFTYKYHRKVWAWVYCLISMAGLGFYWYLKA